MPSRLENLIDACRLGGCWRRRIGIDELGESEDHCIDMFRESRQAHGPVSKPRPVPSLTRSVIWCCRYPPFPWKAVRAASSPAEAGYTPRGLPHNSAIALETPLEQRRTSGGK